MAITARALLRKWFGRGKYPTAEQFAAIFDSFWHKEEDSITVDRVDGLAHQINSKYDAANAELLEEEVKQAASTAQELKKDVTNAFQSIGEIENHIEENCIQKTTRLILSGGSPADLGNNK